MIKTLWAMGFLLVQTIWLSPAGANDLPAGALRAGTLANQKLVRDTMAGVVVQVSLRGCDKPTAFRPYVLKMPEGPAGSRHWVEEWVVSGCNREYPLTIDFSEDGLDAANWAIRPGR